MTDPYPTRTVFDSLKNYRWILHLIFWGILIGSSYFRLFASGYFQNPKVPTSISYSIFLTKSSFLFIMCYVFQFLVVPLYRSEKKYRFWVGLIILFCGTFLIEVGLIKFFVRNLEASATTNFSFLSISTKNLSNFLFLFSTYVAFYYFVDIYDQQKAIKRLERFKTEKIALESSFLKSQVNPHFLFNTLNNIYALSLKKSEQTKVIIERLESLLYYMLYECKADLVPLENEFTFTNSYIELEKLRHKEDQCTVTVNINGDPNAKMIAPLLLINFLENAFKHGTKASFGKSWIKMDITINQQSVHFVLQNSKPFNTIGQAISEYKGGIGLKNVKRRLQILYPMRHELIINNAKDRFEVDLTINF